MPPRVVPRSQTPRRERPRPARTIKLRIHRVINPFALAKPLAGAPAPAPTPPFTECPAVGLDTSCGILIKVTDASSAILGDPGQGPYDGADDTLVGVLNSSGSTVSSIALSADTNLFGFDGDGLCAASPAPGCPFGPSGYEGPGTSFVGITPDQTGGVVNFSPGIPPGQSAYFSLEEPLLANAVVVGGPSAAEQGGPANPSEKQTTCSTVEPINCATGVYWHQFTDVSVPGRGVPLSFTPTYASSRAAVDGSLGFGSTDNYHMSLTTDASGNVTITQENEA